MARSLLEASARDDRVLLERALSHELGVYDHDDMNQALYRAALNGNSQCVERLIAEGAEIDSDDTDGDTPLMLAAANDHINVVRLLLSYGCDIDLQSNRDRSALHMAVWNRCLRIVELLTDIGCQVNLRERYGDSPLMLAARRGYPDVMRMLLRRQDCDVQVRSYEKDTALHYAAKHGHRECLGLVLDRGPDLEARTLWGHTPLLLAAMAAHNDCALTLLEAGANSRASDRSEKQVAHYLAKNNMIRCLEYVLARDPNCANCRDNDDVSPLMEAVHSGHNEAVILLIRSGADVRISCKATLRGKYAMCTPLEVALHTGRVRIASMLAAAGSSSRNLQVFSVSFPDLTLPDCSVRWLADTLLSGPSSLQDLCGCVIRSCLPHGACTISNVALLPLPASLRDFVRLRDVA